MSNPIQEWMSKDKALHDLVVEIQSMDDKTPMEQAEIAFYRVAQLYNLPKMPQDVVDCEDELGDDDDEEPRSLFVEHALLRYLEPDIDPRGIVLTSAYYVKNNLPIDIRVVAEKEFGENPPENCMIGIRGQDFYGEVIFPQKEGKSWLELGCVYMAKMI